MRIDLYTDAGGSSLWKRVTTGVITRYTELQVNRIVDYTIEGKTIKFGTTYIVNPVLKNDAVLFTSAETYNPYEIIYCRNGFAWFNVVSTEQQGAHYCAVNGFNYFLTLLNGGNGLYGYPLNAMRIAEIEIDGTQCVAFFFWFDEQHTMMSALVVSANFFDGSFAPRYTPPTIPDDDAGYGTGETPNGNQAGAGTPGGGDHISVYPPNVEVNVEVNMPEPEKVARAQPSSIHIALINETSLNCLVNALWGADQAGFKSLWQMFENYKFNPVAGVIACMRLPRWVTSQLSIGTTPIGIAGTTILGFVGGAVGQNTIIKHTWSTGLSSGDNPTYLTQFKDFKDFVGVTVRAYAPFIGWFDLDPSLCFGGNIEFRYFCDVASGNLGLEIWGTTVDKTDTQKHEMLLATGSGNCAYPVVISGNDNGMGDYITGFSQSAIGIATSVVGGFTENPMAVLGGTSSVFVGMNKIAAPQSHTTMVGDISGSKGYLGYLIPFVQVIKPRYALPDSYEAVYGRPVSGGRVVSDFEGCYAELDVHCSTFGFANEQEQKKIIDMLAKGVHV